MVDHVSMPTRDDTVQALRSALELTPDSVPLRRHLAEVLRGLGRFDEAILELRQAVRAAADDVELRLELAACYAEAGKPSHALVVLEALEAGDRLPPTGLTLLAKLQLAEGDWESARQCYRAAVKQSPEARDSALAERLGFEDTDAPAGADAGEEHEHDDEEAPTVPSPGPASAAGSPLERPTITFADVGGMQEVKDEIAIKILQPLLTPELFAAYGKKSGGGVLLYGPPGCGKTLLARATAGELRGRFLAVGIHDVLDMWLGKSERNLHALFDEARRSTPCVIFFDEVDALGGKCTDMAHSAGRTVVNQLLSELDGTIASNEGVLVLGATNAPWQLDSAFRRPGRFDRVLFVPPPDASAREAVLRGMLAGKPQEALDLAALSRKTEGYSGADLEGVVDFAIEEKLRQALRTGKQIPLTDKDLVAALKRVAPSTREWFATARNHALSSNQGGVYDELMRYLKL